MQEEVRSVNVADGGALARTAILDGLREDPREPLAAWCDQYRILNQTYAAEPGRWRTDRTPYLKEILDDFSPSSRVETVVLMKGAQLGFTEALTNMIGYIIHRAPGPAMMVQPTQGLAKRYSKQRLATMIQDMPVLTGLVADPRARDSGNTTLAKNFDGGVLFIAGANSAADLRSAPVRFLLLDEVDAYPYDVDDEGDPIELALNRTKTFARRKILIGSTPTTKDVSRIEREFKKGDQRRYYLPCPHCDEMQPLQWKQIQWQSDDNGHKPDTVIYACPHCGGVITENHKPAMLAAGEWRAEAAENDKDGRRRSYHISSLYSPWETWPDLVEKWLEAQRDQNLLKTFINTALGECWDEAANRIEPHELENRAEPYRLREVPMGGLVLTAGVDVQDNRLEVVVWAWGRDLEAWVIDWHVLHGEPASRELWTELEQYLQKPIQHESGEALSIAAVAVDSGGHYTQTVYEFCRRRKHIIAIKGQSIRNKAIYGRPSFVDVTTKGKTLRGSARVFPVGSDTAKGYIYGCFGIETGPGSLHYSRDLSSEFYEQLTSEKLVTRYHKGHPRHEWIKPHRKRNEVLDCTVYALAAAHHLGINRYREIDWNNLEESVCPRNKSLFESAGAIDNSKEDGLIPPPAKRTRSRARGGFVSQW